MKFAALLLCLSSLSFAQSLNFGTVVGNANPNYSPGLQLRGLNFALMNGGFNPTNTKGKLVDYADHFSFVRGQFALQKTDGFFCKDGCTFSGTFDSYSFSITPISAECSQVTGHLSGTFSAGQSVARPATANYSQTWCHLPDTFEMGGGGLSVVFSD